MPSTSKQVFFEDRIFSIYKNVYEPEEDSFFLVEHLLVERGDSVLDMGTGCGIIGILAASRGADVVAVDINPFAVHCAQENAASNHVSAKFSVVRGDLFRPLGTAGRFDAVLFNAPYLPAESSDSGSWLTRGWAGGASGREVIDRFISEAPNHLSAGGRVFLVQSTLSGIEETLMRFAASGLNAHVLAHRDMPFFESLVIVTAER